MRRFPSRSRDGRTDRVVLDSMPGSWLFEIISKAKHGKQTRTFAAKQLETAYFRCTCVRFVGMMTEQLGACRECAGFAVTYSRVT
jgi:hypothetical protein